MAGMCGNRTHPRRNSPHNGFEVRGRHQATLHSRMANVQNELADVKRIVELHGSLLLPHFIWISRFFRICDIFWRATLQPPPVRSTGNGIGQAMYNTAAPGYDGGSIDELLPMHRISDGSVQKILSLCEGIPLTPVQLGQAPAVVSSVS